ncbi:hypothetical protein LI129_22925, partial [Erysipelatoclostridium ramosum]|uniref:hypothetical protein n=1 Tax=Thomasclavelia ramosa TaxID=1547 RepID=UPI001D083BFD
ADLYPLPYTESRICQKYGMFPDTTAITDIQQDFFAGTDKNGSGYKRCTMQEAVFLPLRCL